MQVFAPNSIIREREKVAFYYKTQNSKWSLLRNLRGIECRATILAIPGRRNGYSCDFDLNMQSAEGLTLRASISKESAQCWNGWTPNPKVGCGDTLDIQFRITDNYDEFVRIRRDAA